ncbi:unnamed protein product [Rotaria magnacalcarata]|uniref:Pentatricopeptide repeat-containing protein n=3 Tax=Rotaria magnacalcarata TaxID=392030 RepID=A0A816U184_9BILA|nr:unnamed protein product [Rotaria magnacalcarata]
MNHFISIKFINYRVTSMKVFTKSSSTVQSKFELGNEMKSFNDKKQFKKALELFDKHMKNNIEVHSSLVITQALKACTHIKDVQRGSDIHRLISSRIQHDFHILASLLHFYMQCGNVSNAELLFNETKKKTLATYGAMMKGYIKNNMPNQAIDLFYKIENPDKIIIMFVFNACASLGTSEALDLTKKTLEKMPKTFYSDSYILCSVLDALMKCGDVKYAESIYKSSTTKALPMYGAMMKGYLENNDPKKTIELFKQITNPSEVVFNLCFNACASLGTSEALDLTKKTLEKMPKTFYSDSYILCSVLDALMKCGDVKYAESIYNSSTTKALPMYGAMMKGYIKNNCPGKAINLFKQIENPSEVNLIVFFNVCAQLRTQEALSLVKQTVKKMRKSYYLNSRLLTSLLDAFIKCGDSSSGEILFSKMKKSVENYGNLMSGFNKENNPEKTLDLFNKMKNDGIQANVVIYLVLLKLYQELVIILYRNP